MSELKPYLADVPVRVNIWIRPHCQRKQFEVLKEARPSIMFLISDGGRNEREWEAIRQNRAIFDNEIDWDCTVYKIYEDKNNGLYTMSKKGAELIWSKVDRCIFLEDDQVVSVSYFKYCEELLEKYKDDTRIQAICAMNHNGTWDDTDNDYFFARCGAIWGLATWKRTLKDRELGTSYSKDKYTMSLILKNAKDYKEYQRRLEGYAKSDIFEGHVAGGEFYHDLSIYGQNRLYIVPKRNMMSNIGCTENSAHSTEYKLLPRAMKKIFNMKTYELEFPLKHPEYVVADGKYEKRRAKIMATDSSVRRFFRKIEATLLSIRYGVAFKKLKKKLARRNQIEK